MNKENQHSTKGSKEVALMSIDARPLWKRKIQNFFGYHPPTPDLKDWSQDIIITRTIVHFSIIDRILLLFFGKVSMKTWTYCQFIPGKVESESHSKIEAPNMFK